MNLIRILITALVGLLSTSLFVSAFTPAPADAQDKSAESAKKKYVVNFHDEITLQDFDEVSNWISKNGGEIVLSSNENFAKFIVAKADPSISN